MGLNVKSMKRVKTTFRLQFEPARIKELAASYQYGDDTEPLAAGRRIASGDFSRGNVEVIFRWKTRGRGVSRLQGNPDLEISDALRLAGSAKTERAAVAVLCGLGGVDIPVASAILTMIDPERYTIIDYRALEALGVAVTVHTITSYLEYLDQCRKLALENDVSLRELDRALWQWSKDQP
jgi:hypothetical protein